MAARRKTLSDKGVAALKARAARWTYPDPEVKGHYVRITPNGAKSYVAVAREPATGRQIWATIGATDVLGLDDARTKAREVIHRIRTGQPAFDPPPVQPRTVADIAATWITQHVERKGLRSGKEIGRILDSYILPAWRDREFESIRRSDVALLLDNIEAQSGARTADIVLAYFRSMANWHATRTDNYQSPIVKGMRRENPTDRARERIFTDDELRAVWKAAEGNETFGAFVRLALLTAQRREKVATLRWQDVAIDGKWTIPGSDREKGNPGELQLTEAALAIIRSQPHLGANPYVLTGRGDGPFNGYSRAKLAFDAKLPTMQAWTIHDLRRTARSLMSRAGVRPDIAEQVLGHAIPGVRGIYDRHQYALEKADAIARLGVLIENIVHPTANVVPMHGASR